MENSRITKQQLIVFETVMSLNNHPTADEVYSEINTKHPTISRRTVYRNLNKLVDHGYLSKIHGHHIDRYDYHLHDHSHIKCRMCGKFIDYENPNIDRLHNQVEDDSGFKLLKSDLVFEGICPSCQELTEGGHVINE